MKRIYLIILVAGTLAITGCPRPKLPDFCDKPAYIFVDPACYDSDKGLTIKASPIESSDSTSSLSWMVYILADSSQQAPYSHPQVKDIPAGYTLTLPDSLLNDNQKVYVEVRSRCAGVPDEKTIAINGDVFVRRFNKANDCYQWTERND